MRKIAFVVQRYGEEVNGGAELQCKQFAERLKGNYDLEILTTCAVDYMTWKNEYSEGLQEVAGVKVRRFPVDYPREVEQFNRFSASVLPTDEELEKLRRGEQVKQSKLQEEKWMKMQGPYSTALLSFLKDHKDEYDCFVFFTYLYATTYFGLQICGENAVLVPEAHDEKPIHLSIFQDMFRLPKAIFFNTPAEKKFVDRKFAPARVADKKNNQGHGGVGVDLPASVEAARFREKYAKQLGNAPFMLYIGRIEAHKGCGALFSFFKEYKKRHPGDLKLVLMGKAVMQVPEREDIISLGFVSEEDKFDGIADCSFLVLPSEFESLSMVVLEAMKLKKPVLINGKCEVVKNHCLISNGGLYYENYPEFAGCVDYLLEHGAETKQMGENGLQYVDTYYSWANVLRELQALIDEE